MTTPSARVRANRRNAGLSTGPRTEAGKRRVSANARRHGLAIPLDVIPELIVEVERLARAIAGDGATKDRLNLARQIATAQVDLKRIREARHQALRLMVQDPNAWVDQTLPEFHFRRPTAINIHPLFMAVRFAQARALKVRRPALAAWSKTLDRLDRYERRALSRRKMAARQWLELADNKAVRPNV